MTSQLAVTLFTALLFLSSQGPAVASNERDVAAIRLLTDRWQAAWNSHDMTAMARLLTEDADFVNVAGLHWKGRPQIEKEHVERHRTNLKNSVWATHDVAVQILDSNFALVHIKWGISGDTDFDGTPRSPRQGVFSWLVVRRSNAWLIRSVHNTNITPPK